MKMKKGLIATRMLLLALIISMICTGLLACDSESTKPTNAPTDAIKNNPMLDLPVTELKGMVRTEIGLPSVTATDVQDGDLTANVRLKILFEDDAKYVLPAVNANQGVLASDHPSYVPTKVGTYIITYFVEDADGNTATATVTMMVSANDTDERGQNLASKDNLDKWIVGDEVQNSVINEYGEIVIAGKYGQNYTGAVYQGQKIQNSDTVVFTFQAKPLTELMFYNVSFLLTPSYEADVPTADEGTWPMYFNMRIGEQITTFAVTDSNVNFDLLPLINLNLLDGKEHTIALSITADSEKVNAKIWIDVDPSSAPSATNTIYKVDIQQKYGENTKHLKIFDEKICGWLSFGAFCTGADTSNDGMILKSVSINGNSAFLSPKITVGDFKHMLVNQTYTLPAASAKDTNDYSDITDRLEVYLKTPSGEFEPLSDTSFVPTEAGKYTIRYVVIDRSGNQSYAEYTVNCAKSESDTPPTIVFDSAVQDTYTVNLGDSFTVPTPTQVVDSFGDDISKNMTIRLIGREKAQLSAGDSFTFRATGTNILRYEVTDYNDNVTYKDIAILVTGGNIGNLFADTDHWYKTSGATINNSMVTILSGGTTITYGGQKIYDEKVSMLVNLDILRSGNDGTGILLIGIRGGKGVNKVPQTAVNPEGSSDYAWPEGMTLLLSNLYGLILKGDGYNSSDLAVAQLPDGTIYDTFNGKDVELSFQATDVYEGDVFKGIRFQLWLDGQKVKWGGSLTDENGDVFLPSRVVNINEHLTQAGWLSFYFNDADTVNNEHCVLKALTIDGTKPAELKITADKEENQTFEIGETYTLPVVTVLAGDEDVSANVKKYIWITGEEYPDLSGEGYLNATITPDADYLKGFTVIYTYQGRVIKSIPVRNSAPVVIKLEKDSYTAKLGEIFAMPKFTAELSGVDVSKYVVVKVQIGNTEQVVDGDAYEPKVEGKFTINYYVFDVLVKSQDVTVKSAQTDEENLAESGHVTPGKAWVHLDSFVYNNDVSITFQTKTSLMGGSYIDFALRGSEQTADAWFSHSKGLRLQIKNDANWGTYIQVGYGNNNGWFEATFGESELKYTNVDWTQEHTITYSICDVYENGVFTGIRIEVSLDGERIRFTGTSGGDGSYVWIPASTIKTAPQEHFIPSYLFVWASGTEVIVKEAYIITIESGN